MRKIEYQSYERPYDKRELRLGDLVFDFVYPETKDPYRHSDLPAAELDKWAVSDERPTCYVATRGKRSASFGFGLQDLLAFNTRNANESYTVIVGKNGSQVRLLRPEEFFRENVLTNKGARLWLVKHLTVIHRLKLVKNYIGLEPKIWLLIGLYYMNDAVTCHASAEGSGFGVKGSVPVDPSGLGTLFQLDVGARVRLSKDLVVERGSEVSGEKVWAALWQRVDTKYLIVDATKRYETALNELRLLDIYSSEAVRGGPNDKAIAEISLAAGPDDPEDDDSDAKIPDEFWEEMAEELQAIEEDYF